MKFLELDNSENSVGQHCEKRSHYLQKKYLLGKKRKKTVN